MDTEFIPISFFFTILNQIYELEQKVTKVGDAANFTRNIIRLKDAMAAIGFRMEDPMGQAFNDTRTDVEVSISGNETTNLVIVEVIKPIIRRVLKEGVSVIVQKGIVVVESRKDSCHNGEIN